MERRKEGDRRKMEFDRSRVYSAVNADELKPGDKVIAAHQLGNLKYQVSQKDSYVQPDYNVWTIKEIKEDTYSDRFVTVNGAFPLVYLVERKENCTNCALKNSMQSCRIALSVLHKCKDYKPKTEPKAEKDCDNCGQRCDGYGKGEVCSQWIPKAEKHTDYNHCEEAKKGCACAMTNACPNKHYRPFKDTDELIKVWDAKMGTPNWGTNGDLTMPHIWVRRKKANSKGQLITEFSDELHVSMGKEGYNMTDLFVYFTFLDGSPCGVEA